MEPNTLTHFSIVESSHNPGLFAGWVQKVGMPLHRRSNVSDSHLDIEDGWPAKVMARINRPDSPWMLYTLNW